MMTSDPEREAAGKAVRSGDSPLRELDRTLNKLRARLTWLVAQHRIPAQDREDLVQQTLLALVLRLDEIRDPELWVLGTMRNKCRRYWHLRRTRPVECRAAADLDEILPGVHGSQATGDIRRDLERLAATLPEETRRVLRHRFVLGLRATEVADALGRPASTVRQMTSRGLRALRKALLLDGEVGHGQRRGVDTP